jgi:hypothetical protein
MIKVLCEASNRQHSGFYLNRPEKMSEILKNSPENLFIPGVTYALLDFFQSHKLKIPDAVVLETGGMKGKRKEIIRAELHELLTSLTGTKKIHSEYGMSELLSQAYALKDGLFLCPPWMKILIRDAHDPFGYANQKETGIIRVIDLANIHSCCFIETQDLGRMVQDHAFEVLGREDQSEWRGCNLMI